jgi:hypothetical protein
MKLAILLTIGLMIGCLVSTTTAQSAKSAAVCRAGETAPLTGSWTWAENSHVQVYVRIPDFAENEVPYMLVAIQNWDASYLENGSGVRFEYRGTVTEAKGCDACLTITRGETSDRRHGAELHAFSKRVDQVIDYAWIVINPVNREAKSLTSVIAHEIGHSLGLLDCYSCNRGSTAMGHFKSTLKLFRTELVSLSKGVQGPTACDGAQVKEAYRELRIAVRPSPKAALLEPQEEGEEPEEDDTPIVVP